jgi:hypothetical protein
VRGPLAGDRVIRGCAAPFGLHPSIYEYPSLAPQRIHRTNHAKEVNMATAQRVTREANLIARQFECLGEEAASAATANHVRLFWAPLLKAELKSAAGAHPELFSSIAQKAVSALRDDQGQHAAATSDAR